MAWSAQPLARASTARSELSPLSAFFKTVSVLGKSRNSNASTRGTNRASAEQYLRRRRRGDTRRNHFRNMMHLFHCEGMQWRNLKRPLVAPEVIDSGRQSLVTPVREVFLDKPGIPRQVGGQPTARRNSAGGPRVPELLGGGHAPAAFTSSG